MQKIINTLTWNPMLKNAFNRQYSMCLLTLIARLLDAGAVGKQLIVAISK